MIDHLIRFASEDAAKADPVCGGYWNGAAWDRSRVNPDVKVWKPADDTVQTVQDAAGSSEITVHSYLDYFYLMIAAQQVDEALRNHPTCMLVADRTAARSGQPFIVYSPLPSEQLAEYMLEPCFAGSGYPFGVVS